MEILTYPQKPLSYVLSMFNFILIPFNQCNWEIYIGINVNYDTMRYKRYKGALQKILSTELFLWATSVIF